MTGKMLTVKDAAGRLGVPVNTVYKLTAERQLAHYRIGRAVRIDEADLDRYISGCYKSAQAPVSVTQQAVQAVRAASPTMTGPQARRAARAAMAAYGEGYTGLDCLKR
nr:helix-turn-helix domain-containing protein [uncultured Dysosmobacter sp.]